MTLQQMEFTGERFVPQLSGEIKYEHLHRYALCLKLSKNKTVLDIASGEGYGAFILSKDAKTVIGVDIDHESIKHSQQKYHHIENLKFLLGDCTAIPLPDNSVDVVTSFETIEHHDKHEEMILEIKRVLNDEGKLIISSPNRLIYSDEPNYSNPYHVKELYYEEFVSLLSRHFNKIDLYGQRLASASFVSSLKASNLKNYTAYTGEINDLAEKTCSLTSPVYFLAICSDQTQSVDLGLESVYIDAEDDLLGLLQDDRRRAQIQLKKYELKLEESQSQLHLTRSELEESQSQFQLLYQEWENSLRQVYLAQNGWERSLSIVTAMESSKFWKLRQFWFKIKYVFGINNN